MAPRFFQSVQILRGTFGHGGRLEFGDPASTVSGAIWETPQKTIDAGTGETFTTNAQGFFPAGVDLRRRDHLLVISPVSGARYEVFEVVSGHDHAGRASHVGARLRVTPDV